MASRSMTRPTLADVLVGQGMVAKSTVDHTLSRLGGVSAELGATLLGEGALSGRAPCQTGISRQD